MVSVEPTKEISTVLRDGPVVLGKVCHVLVSFAHSKNHAILVLPHGAEAVVLSRHLVIKVIDEIAFTLLTRIIFRCLDAKLLLFAVVKILQILFHGKVGAEGHQTLAQVDDHVHFLHQQKVQLLDIVLDVTAGLVHFRNEVHFVFLAVDDLVHVLFVGFDQVFFLVEDFADQVVVVLVHLVEIVAVLQLHVTRRRHCRELVEILEQHHGRDPGSLLGLEVLIELNQIL